MDRHQRRMSVRATVKAVGVPTRACACLKGLIDLRLRERQGRSAAFPSFIFALSYVSWLGTSVSDFSSMALIAGTGGQC